MKKSKIVLCCMIWLLFFCFICVGANLSHAAKMEYDIWSFDFKDCSVSDALIRIAETTGIDISTDKPINKKLCKSYDVSTIDQILKDIFRRENYAMVWYYSESGLDSVDIWIFESSESNNNFHRSRHFRKTSAKGGTTRKKVDYKSVIGKGQSKNDNLICLKDKSENHAKASKDRDFRSGKLSDSEEQPVSNDFSRGLQKYGVNKKSTGTSATLNDNLGTGVHDGNVETTDKYTLSPPPVPDKQHGLEPPPMPPGFSGKN